MRNVSPEVVTCGTYANSCYVITVEHRLSVVQYSIEVKSYAQPSSVF